MKKIIVFGVASVLSLAMGMPVYASHTALAANSIASSCNFTAKDQSGHCGNHTDVNNDGICDNGDNYCMNYSDADNDGICDNCNDDSVHEKSHDTGHHNRIHHSNKHGRGNHHR